jgi:hypothetical protein
MVMQPPIVQNTPQGQGTNSHHTLPSEEIRKIVEDEIAPLKRELKILKWCLVPISVILFYIFFRLGQYGLL